MVKQRYLTIASIFACIFALFVIGLGAFTRLVDAGLGCPDWPLCYGHLTVPARDKVTLLYQNLDVFKAWAEMIHRYFAASLSFMICIIIYLIFSKEVRNRSNIIFGCCLIGLIIYQILLGQWTVTYKLLPIVVTQHLLGGFLIVTVLWLIYLNNRDKNHSESNVSLSVGIKIGAVIGLVLIFLQILLGAWTSTNYASFSCPDFPFCINQPLFQPMNFKEAFTIFPTAINYEGGVLSETARQTIQMMHRCGALMVLLYLIVFTSFFIRKTKHRFARHRILYLLWGILLLQICLGIINVLFKLPITTAIGHNLLAVVLLLAIVTLVFELFASRKVTIHGSNNYT